VGNNAGFVGVVGVVVVVVLVVVLVASDDCPVKIFDSQLYSDCDNSSIGAQLRMNANKKYLNCLISLSIFLAL
jgi:hypothetical protein